MEINGKFNVHFCGKEIETLEHMYFSYDIVKNIWEEIMEYI